MDYMFDHLLDTCDCTLQKTKYHGDHNICMSNELLCDTMNVDVDTMACNTHIEEVMCVSVPYFIPEEHVDYIHSHLEVHV